MREEAEGNAPLTEWTRRIADDEMPIFGHTVQEVVSISQNDNAPSAELARAVLQDASMTARVLKLVNTIIYNPRARSISTISRAVVVLGFDTVRDMCLSIALVDALVQGAPREHLTRELARSFHAAVQARAIAAERGDDSPEEVFIATLLYRLGHLAFWCFSGEKGDELDAAMKLPDHTPEQAQDEVLGFRLDQLTTNLVKEWRVNELLRETLTNPKLAGSRGKTINVGHRLAVAAEKGWTSRPVQEVAQEIGRMAGLSARETSLMLHTNAREAARIAGYYGAATAAKTIPLPGEYKEDQEQWTAEEEVAEYPEPDNMLQLKMLRELSSFVDEGSANFNLVMEMVLEGIYRGVGMDRTLFALITPDRRGIRAKFMLGPGRENLVNNFHFTRLPNSTNIFFASVDKLAPTWVDTRQNPEQVPLMPQQVIEAIGREPFFVAPIVVNGKPIGLFYADRALSGRDLDDDAYEGFRYFVQQGNMGLTVLAGRKNGR